MTASQVAGYRFPEDLPVLAQDPRVQVRFDLSWTDGAPCGSCPDGLRPIPWGTWSIVHRWTPDGPEHVTHICSAACAERELDDLLHRLIRVPARITLRCPEEWAQDANWTEDVA
jgi:hypothetical protein